MARIDTRPGATSSPVFVDSPTIESTEQHGPPLDETSVPEDRKALSYLIISGGTGANSIANAFGPSPAFVLPVSDDGGSSSEILRCFGGPSIGDIRSRLIRLIPLPTEPTTAEEKERQAIYDLFAFRFPADAAEKAVREIWLEIVEGRSELWDGIGEDKKEVIRAFLVHFQTLCLRRAHKRFSFRNFSLGNGFLTGARDLFGSLPSAIFLFKSIAGVDAGVQVIPVINTNQTVTIAAQLANATTLVGQCAISHPSPTSSQSHSSASTPRNTSGISRQNSASSASRRTRQLPHYRRDSRTFDTEGLSSSLHEVSPGPGLPPIDDESAGSNLAYRKGEEEVPLEARIERIFYINLYGQEIFPEPNPEFLQTIAKRDILVYSCGSLWTSIIPSLALRGLASAIATSSSLKAKVVLLNSVNDRETPDYKASEYITAILGTLRHYNRPQRQTTFTMPSVYEACRLVSHLVYLEGAGVELDAEQIAGMGVEVVRIPRDVSGVQGDETPMFSQGAVEWAMERIIEGLGR